MKISLTEVGNDWFVNAGGEQCLRGECRAIGCTHRCVGHRGVHCGVHHRASDWHKGQAWIASEGLHYHMPTCGDPELAAGWSDDSTVDMSCKGKSLVLSQTISAFRVGP